MQYPSMQETYEPSEDTVSVVDDGGGGRPGEEGVNSVDVTAVATTAAAAAADFGTKTGAFTA